MRAIADTGVTAIVRGAGPGPNILWRADIDGLPLLESTGLPFASTNGATHACGHDGHTAIALTRAHRPRSAWPARRYCPLRFSASRGTHRWGEAHDRSRGDGGPEGGPGLWAPPLGQLAARTGAQPRPIFAAATHIRIIIRGRGGYAAAPHQTIDPIVVASHVVIALQTIVSRAVDPADTAVVTIGRIEGGVRGNIIPNEVMLSGTIRTFEPKVLERILRRVDEIVAGVTQAWRRSTSSTTSTLPAVVNDVGAAELAQRVAAFVGPEHIGPARATGADDMSYFLERAPGAYILLGAAPRNAEHVHPHHHPGFDFDEGALSLGTELGVR